MNKIKLKTEAYISLYAELAERRLEAFEFAEYRQEEGVDVFVKDTNGDIIHSEWASEQFVDECNVIEDILISHGIIQEI
tara:strand:+ start:155 stop:391 length:237 start_codon:yes stop_codon:yes gene_type:complete